jgi:hypothetical protein
VIYIALNISLIIFGIHAATRDGMIFEHPRVAIQNAMDGLLGVVWSEWLQKPLFSCVVCMSSVWGVMLSVYFGVALYDIPAMILTVTGINFVTDCFTANFINKNI